MTQLTPNHSSNEPWLQVLASRYFTSWLAEQNVSLAFTTYQAGKLFFLGRRNIDQLSVFERTFAQSTGLWMDQNTGALWMSSQHQLWRFENYLAAGSLHEGYDGLYVPQVSYTTGNLEVHDIAVEASGRVVFINTLFGCIATLHERASFAPVWKPPFLSALVPQDRCHLNGLALKQGMAKYVTVVSTSDVVDGWRDRRRDGGCVIDVPSGDIVARNLSMPHSPRWYDDKLWVLNSGTGEIGHIDLASGQFQPMTFCPGYLRGLTFIGDYAVVTLSKPRHDLTFGGLSLADRLVQLGATAQCGVQIIDLKSGHVVHWLRIEGMVTELYDIALLPSVQRPMALGLRTDEIARFVTIGSLSEP